MDNISFPFSLPDINSSLTSASDSRTNSLPGLPGELSELLTENLGAQVGEIATDIVLRTEKPNDDERIFQRSEFTFLPQIAQILELIESSNDKQEINKLTLKLKESFQRCHQILEDLPGADLSREAQDELLAEEKDILQQKK
ncbi:6098_t:CDS:2 [Paraglomus occultum]|uniref:Mediator of RNA polymerase II transcription subunit 9 n=1 Tax=Paraglomus occultum TaxID=144539 RepID=A0A9N8WDL3_9GLOM|nr:6098_t:CDS:2 [Paraglomus occultum]